ncbi:MAG: type II toxin-antitoxin system prevent-host-death family antitoxin [Candidatus Latescibacteria bacterium]|nr:type II toxin-antitoxin system prevent-host-death family antitoxin [Candidatus Latescibacterota bacterium]
MPEIINAKQLRARLKEVVSKVRDGERFTVLYRSRPAFDIVPVGSPPMGSTPLESDSLYQAPAVGASESGDIAARHDEVLYR